MKLSCNYFAEIEWNCVRANLKCEDQEMFNLYSLVYYTPLQTKKENILYRNWLFLLLVAKVIFFFFSNFKVGIQTVFQIPIPVVIH